MHTQETFDFMAWFSDEIQDNLKFWQIHKCHIHQHLISQNQPMKLIYHYENLSDEMKIRHPLTGNLLKNFDNLFNREQFAELLSIPIQQVANPFQLKFVGKLIVFTTMPEIALRLQWANTQKNFEPVYTKTLTHAIENGFEHFQLFNQVEIICKDPKLIVTIHQDGLNIPWQSCNRHQFVPLPSIAALTVQKWLLENQKIRQTWQTLMIEQANQLADEVIYDKQIQ